MIKLLCLESVFVPCSLTYITSNNFRKKTPQLICYAGFTIDLYLCHFFHFSWNIFSWNSHKKVMM